MSKRIGEVFGPNGLLKQAFPNYAPRQGQVEMTLAVAEVAENGGRAIIEAGTGTGKSFAYLVPLIELASKGERVLVVTSSILLQHQLIEKDLPLLASILPETFTYALSKGLQNYACKNELEDFRSEVAMLGARDPDIAKQWPVVDTWADTTLDGDLAELPFELHPKVRLKMTTDSDSCLGRKCAHYDGCYGMMARKRARSAQLIVTNYSMFFVDLSVKAGDETAGPLPPYKHLVFDEAHEAPDIARDFFGFRVSMGVIKRATQFLSGNARLNIPELGSKELRSRVRAAAEQFFDEVKRFSERRDYIGRIEGPGAFDPKHLNAALQEVSREYGAVVPDVSDVAQAALAGAMLKLTTIRQQLELAAENHEPWRFVYFVESEPTAVAMKPIQVAPMLDKHLFSGPTKSITLTSATLASGSGDGMFDFFKEEIGVTDATELQVESPFDFAHNVLLWLPKPMHDPNQPEFLDELAETAWQLASAAGGRMLGLFTSFKALRHVRQTLERRGCPWRLLVHGDAPRAQLVAEFKADETSVLLGTKSFWTGVDVPGPALSAVLIDKIAFPHHDDPVTGAVSATDKNWFANRSLPLATIAMRQGFGRLIRTSTDRGVVAVCDPRLRTKGYGKKITKSLPAGLPSTSNLADVRQFFASVEAGCVQSTTSEADRGQGNARRAGPRL